MTTVGEAAASGGLIWRALGAWADLRGAMRAELDRAPSEGRLLFYAILSGLIFFLGRAMIIGAGPMAPTLTGDEKLRLVAAAFVSAVFYRTIALYLVAALAGFVARRFGGTGSWRETRAAVFWGALVAAPAVLAAALLSVLLTEAPGRAAQFASMVGAVASGWVLAHCMAEAHGFPSVWKVLGVLVALVAGFILAIRAAQGLV